MLKYHVRDAEHALMGFQILMFMFRRIRAADTAVLPV